MLEHSDIESGQEEERRLPLHHSTKIPNWTGYTSTGSPSQLQRKLLTSAPQSLSGLLPIPDLLLMDSRNDKKEVKLHALTNFKNGRKPSQRRLTRTMSNSTTNQIPNALYVAAWFLLATLLFGIYYHYIHSKHNTLQPFAMKFPSASRRNSIRYSYAPWGRRRRKKHEAWVVCWLRTDDSREYFKGKMERRSEFEGLQFLGILVSELASSGDLRKRC